MNGFKIKKIVTIVMITLVLLIGLDYGVSVYCYNNVFGKRLDTYEPTALKVSDFEGLTTSFHRTRGRCFQDTYILPVASLRG